MSPWLAIFVGVIAVWLVWRVARPSRLPPSPPGLPILGHVFQIPLKQMFLKLDEWKGQYGDIYTLNVAGRKMVVLSGAKDAADILDRMSGVTSGRPRFVMAGEIMTHNLLYAFMQYGDRWRRLRRVTHEGFNVRAAEAYYPFQEGEAANLVKSLMADPSNIGKQLEHEEKIKRVDYIAETLLRASMPMAYLVDIFPFLKLLPTWAAGRWKRYGEDFFRDTDTFYKDLIFEGRLQKKGVEHHSGFIVSASDSLKRFEVTDQEAAWTAGGLFAAGVETTAAALHQFVLAMVLNPDVARTAQKHIDAVVGGRPPTFSDRSNLPYLQALIKETLRWRPIAALGMPHVATDDFTYEDYLIPKGTVLISNIWSICHDPVAFPDHEVFRPERYLDPNGRLKEAMVDYHEDILTYGYGRRVCPGRDFANNSLFIDMAYLLWAFDFCKAVDIDGKEVTPSSMEFVDHGLTIHPAPFKYNLKPRHTDLMEILRSGG